MYNLFRHMYIIYVCISSYSLYILVICIWAVIKKWIRFFVLANILQLWSIPTGKSLKVNAEISIMAMK